MSRYVCIDKLRAQMVIYVRTASVSVQFATPALV